MACYNTLGKPFAHVRKTWHSPSDIYVENVHFDWFNQYLCTGEHFQSDLDIFRFDFMFMKPHYVPPLLCFNVQTDIFFFYYNSSFFYNAYPLDAGAVVIKISLYYLRKRGQWRKHWYIITQVKLYHWKINLRQHFFYSSLISFTMIQHLVGKIGIQNISWIKNFIERKYIKQTSIVYQFMNFGVATPVW